MADISAPGSKPSLASASCKLNRSIGGILPCLLYTSSLSTGAGQFLLPVLGFLLTGTVHQYIAAWDHWLGFVVFTFLGVNVSREGWNPVSYTHLTTWCGTLAKYSLR